MALTSPRFIGSQRLQRAAANQPVMRQGERGDAVALVQDALVDLGFSMPLTTKQGTAFPDGIFGQETLRAVADFQSRQGLLRDGVLGRNTLHTLDRLFHHEREFAVPFRFQAYFDGWSTSTSFDKEEA